MGNILETFIAGLKGATPQKATDETTEKVEYAVVTAPKAAANSKLGKIPFALAITALILSLTFLFSLSGAALGVAAAGVMYLLRKGGAPVAYGKAVAVISACAILLGTLCACGYAGLNVPQPAPEQTSAPLASTHQTEDEPEEALFTLEVANPTSNTTSTTASASSSSIGTSVSSKTGSSSNANSSSSAAADDSIPETVAVHVTGATQDGIAVTGTLECTPGKPRELALGPGTYTFAFDAIAMPSGETFYKAASTTCTFTGEEPASARLELTLDVEKADQVKTEKEAAAAEAARQAAAAEAEAAAAEANAATVYVTDTGTKYHRAGCQYLKKSQHPMSKSSAQAQGYTPCSRCNP